MKKILSIIVAALALQMNAHAISNIVFNSSYGAGAQIHDLTGTDLLCGRDGWVVSFWFGTEENNLNAIGLYTFDDIEWDAPGEFYWLSDPARPITTEMGDTGYFSIKIFQIEDLVGKTDQEIMDFVNGFNTDPADHDGILDLWSIALSANTAGMGNGLGEWFGSATASGGGTFMDVVCDAFGWVDAQPVSLNIAPIPEPAGVAAFIGVLALGFAAHRRRRANGAK